MTTKYDNQNTQRRSSKKLRNL